MEGNNNENNPNVQTQVQETQQTKQEQGHQEPQGTENVSAEPTYADLLKRIAELKVDNSKLKKANDSLASENGGLRKQVNAKLTEEELRAQQKSEEDDALRQEIAELRKENALNKATKRYMSMNMPEDLATKVAQAEIDGDMELVTSSIKAFNDAQLKEKEEQVKADIYAKMPAPVSGNGDGQVDYNKIFQEKLEAGDMQGAIMAQLMGSQQKAQQS